MAEYELGPDYYFPVSPGGVDIGIPLNSPPSIPPTQCLVPPTHRSEQLTLIPFIGPRNENDVVILSGQGPMPPTPPPFTYATPPPIPPRLSPQANQQVSPCMRGNSGNMGGGVPVVGVQQQQDPRIASLLANNAFSDAIVPLVRERISSAATNHIRTSLEDYLRHTITKRLDEVMPDTLGGMFERGEMPLPASCTCSDKHRLPCARKLSFSGEVDDEPAPSGGNIPLQDTSESERIQSSSSPPPAVQNISQSSANPTTPGIQDVSMFSSCSTTPDSSRSSNSGNSDQSNISSPGQGLQGSPQLQGMSPIASGNPASTYQPTPTSISYGSQMSPPSSFSYASTPGCPMSPSPPPSFAYASTPRSPQSPPPPSAFSYSSTPGSQMSPPSAFSYASTPGSPQSPPPPSAFSYASTPGSPQSPPPPSAFSYSSTPGRPQSPPPPSSFSYASTPGSQMSPPSAFSYSSTPGITDMTPPSFLSDSTQGSPQRSPPPIAYPSTPKSQQVSVSIPGSLQSRVSTPGSGYQDYTFSTPSSRSTPPPALTDATTPGMEIFASTSQDISASTPGTLVSMISSGNSNSPGSVFQDDYSISTCGRQTPLPNISYASNLSPGWGSPSFSSQSSYAKSPSQGPGMLQLQSYNITDQTFQSSNSDSFGRTYTYEPTDAQPNTPPGPFSSTPNSQAPRGIVPLNTMTTLDDESGSTGRPTTPRPCLNLNVYLCDRGNGNKVHNEGLYVSPCRCRNQNHLENVPDSF